MCPLPPWTAVMKRQSRHQHITNHCQNIQLALHKNLLLQQIHTIILPQFLSMSIRHMHEVIQWTTASHESTRMDGWMVFNGSFSTERLFSATVSYNCLYKQISFTYCSIEKGCTLYLVKKLKYIWSGIIINSYGLEVNTFCENMFYRKKRVTRYTQWWGSLCRRYECVG